MLALATKEAERWEQRGNKATERNREAAGCHCSQETVLWRDNEQEKKNPNTNMYLCVISFIAALSRVIHYEQREIN